MTLDTSIRPQREMFVDPEFTVAGAPRASVALERLETLWFNTGTLCNLECKGCYIESSPKNDRLAYISAAEVAQYLDEISANNLGTRAIGFTGGEPFMNPHIMAILRDSLSRGFDVLVLTNGMRPMMKLDTALLELLHAHGPKLTLRVSLDHYTKGRHEELRGPHSWAPTLQCLKWLSDQGFKVHVAGRTLWDESEDCSRAGYAQLFQELGITTDANDPGALLLFPEMDELAVVPEITTSCWSLLGVDPATMMCATSRMVVKVRGADRTTVQACTLLAYDPRFTLGSSLKQATGRVSLNHPHCAKFCVLGGGACSIGA